jgi:hypothetical protein
MSAKTALELGAPIHGVLAFTSTSMYVCLKFIHISYPLTLLFPNFSDKAGRSVPAPGRGALTVAREIQSKHPCKAGQLTYTYLSHRVTFPFLSLPLSLYHVLVVHPNRAWSCLLRVNPRSQCFCLSPRQLSNPLPILDIVTRFQSGFFTNIIRSSVAEVKEKQSMKTTYHLALRTLRQRQVVKKNMLSQCMGYCKIQILALLHFDELLLSGVLQLMTLVSFLYMVQALEQMYVKLVFTLSCC